jgi:hypothetical protein
MNLSTQNFDFERNFQKIGVLARIPCQDWKEKQVKWKGRGVGGGGGFCPMWGAGSSARYGKLQSTDMKVFFFGILKDFKLYLILTECNKHNSNKITVPNNVNNRLL